MVCFYDWLLSQRHRGDAVGLLSVSVSREGSYPRKVNQLAKVLKWSDRHRPTLRDALKVAHREWRKAA